MAISQGSNLINVVVHNSSDSCNASLSAIILSHVLTEGENTDSQQPLLCSDPRIEDLCWRRKDEESVLPGLTANVISC